MWGKWMWDEMNMEQSSVFRENIFLAVNCWLKPNILNLQYDKLG